MSDVDKFIILIILCIALAFIEPVANHFTNRKLRKDGFIKMFFYDDAHQKVWYWTRYEDPLLPRDFLKRKKKKKEGEDFEEE